MNCTEERKNEILIEVSKIISDTYKNKKFEYITVDKFSSIVLFNKKPETFSYLWCGDSLFRYDEDCSLKILSLITEISTDWKELCFELPKPKREWDSDVTDIEIPYTHDYDKTILVTYRTNEIAEKHLLKLLAQQKIYDIIAKTQYDLDPDWVCDRGNTDQYNIVNLEYDHSGSARLGAAGSTYYQSLDHRLYMSNTVANHILGNNLITKEMWFEAFGE